MTDEQLEQDIRYWTNVRDQNLDRADYAAKILRAREAELRDQKRATAPVDRKKIVTQLEKWVAIHPDPMSEVRRAHSVTLQMLNEGSFDLVPS